jgi:hypothetical protein
MESTPTSTSQIKVGTIVQAYGFPMLSGFKGENFYKVLSIDGDSATFARTNEVGDVGNLGDNTFSAKLSDVYKAIESVKNGNSGNGITIWKEETTDAIPGGLAKGMSINDIAKKHNVNVSDLVDEFKKGIKVEMEHTTDVKVAKEISLDHLFEDPKYYTKLSSVETPTSIKESNSKEISDIAALTSTRSDAVQKFIDNNKLNAIKLFKYLKSGKLKDRMDFITALSGTPGNKIQKQIISKFQMSESLKEEAEGAYYKPKLADIIKNSYHILKNLNDNDDLEAWVQDKITIAQHNMDAINGYMKSDDTMDDVKEAYDINTNNIKVGDTLIPKFGKHDAKRIFTVLTVSPKYVTVKDKFGKEHEIHALNNYEVSNTPKNMKNEEVNPTVNLSNKELAALALLVGFKKGQNGIGRELERLDFPEFNDMKQSLIKKGVLNKAGAITSDSRKYWEKAMGGNISPSQIHQWNKKLGISMKDKTYESIQEASSSVYTDWDEYVNPFYILVKLKNGKTIKISKGKKPGSAKVYQALLQAFNDNRYDITDKIVAKMSQRLGQDGEAIAGENINEASTKNSALDDALIVAGKIDSAIKYGTAVTFPKGKTIKVYLDDNPDKEMKIAKKIAASYGWKLISSKSNSDALYFEKNTNENINEASVGVLQKQFAKVVDDIEDALHKFKASKGGPMADKFIKQLKDLNAKKKQLEKDIDTAVSGLYKDAELKLTESAVDFIVNGTITEIQRINEANFILYHTSFTSAAESAREYAFKQGYKIDEDDWMQEVGFGGKTGRGRPSIGKTNSFTVGLLKNDKPQKKALHFQVYGMESGKYELNVYIS